MIEAKTKFNPTINIDISDISAELSYFFVFPFSSTEATNPSNRNVQPFLLTYVNRNQDFGELMKMYLK